MIGNYVPSDDEHWECFLLLWHICSAVCAYEISPDDSVYLYSMACGDLPGKFCTSLYGKTVLLQRCITWYTYQSRLSCKLPW